jgi:hypothetical protein
MMGSVSFCPHLSQIKVVDWLIGPYSARIKVQNSASLDIRRATNPPPERG